MTPQIFATLGSNDLQLYYSHTFMRVKTPNADWHWAYVRDIQEGTPASDALHISLATTHSGSSAKVWPLKDVEFSFDLPPSGLYNFKNTVIYLLRYPYRSPHKGLTNNNCHLLNLLFPVMRAGGIPKEFFSANDMALIPEHLTLLFEQTAPITFVKGLTKILKKQILAFAVTSRIAISQGILSPQPSIWLKNRLVGEMNVDKEQITPIHPTFVPELAN